MELTVLGCSGSYGAPAGGACSGYLVRAGTTVLWVDCGNGSFTNLQQHVHPEELTAVVITHSHPDHCVDLYGLHVMTTAVSSSGCTCCCRFVNEPLPQSTQSTVVPARTR